MANLTKPQEDTAAMLDTQCYHCGSPCEEELLEADGKAFCCNGCKTVYEILSENELCTYYDLENNPGIQLKSRNFGDKFAFLDNEEIARQLLSFADESLHKVTLFLPAMHCSSCIWLLENLYKLQEGILHSRVNFMRKELTLSFNPQQISFREVAELLATLGYEPRINLESTQRDQQQRENRSLYYKIGIAGFCFGNIMLFSFPDYLALEDWMGEGYYKSFFGYMNILLSLPIFFYAASGYFSSAFKSLKAGVINLDVPIALGILALFGRSLYEILSQTGAGYMDSLAGLLFFLLVGKWFQSRTYESLSFERDYRSYFPLAVNLKVGEEIKSQTVTSLKKGDIILIRNQELIPADSILLSEEAFIDYSFVTGESQAIHKRRGDYIYAGGRQIGTQIQLAVEKEVSRSYLTQLWNSEAFNKNNTQDRLHRHVAMFSKYFTYATLLVAFSALLFWWTYDASLMWKVFASVLIVACPCALALSTPYAFGNTMRIFGRNRFYLKNSNVIGHLAEIQQLVFDKTGTITYADDSELEFIGEALNPQENTALASLTSQSTHPLSKKISAALAAKPPSLPQNFEEIEGLGIRGEIEGRVWHIGSLTFMPNPPSEEISKKVQSEVHLSIDGQYRGYFIFQNKYRNGFEQLSKELKAKDYKLSVLSGDNSGERTRLQEILGKETTMHFEQKPKDKLKFIAALQKQKQQVLMLGDGLNDAGALQQSDVGIAISEDTTAFSPACDAILDASNFHKLGDFLAFSHTAMRVVRASFVLSLMYNLCGLAFAVSGTLSPVIAAILMPLSSITVVAFVVAASNILAYRKGLLQNLELF